MRGSPKIGMPVVVKDNSASPKMTIEGFTNGDQTTAKVVWFADGNIHRDEISTEIIEKAIDEDDTSKKPAKAKNSKGK